MSGCDIFEADLFVCSDTKDPYRICVKKKTGDDWEWMTELELKAGENGNIVLPFGEPGTYEYLVEEIPGNDQAILYDQTAYHILMNVIVEGEKLKPVIIVTSDQNDEKTTKISFINQGIEKIQTVPQTGDLSQLTLWFRVLNISLSLIVLFLFLYWRHQSNTSGGKGEKDERKL